MMKLLLKTGTITHWCMVLTVYDVASGTLIPDIMHDILEGALPLVVKQMLKVCDNNYACTSFMSLMLRYLL